jgi:hypothetical protein
MPIEDVDFLKQNSIKQSYIFLVNSAERDRNAYPTPSEYIVDFTTPFMNVVGLQVLNASIPRTMYNVDVRNNAIRFLIYDERIGTNDLLETHHRYVTKHLRVGDYSIQTLLAELNRVLEMPLNGDEDESLVKIETDTTSNPPNVQSLLQFRCPYPFVFDMDASSIAETLGFDLLVDPAEAETPPLLRRFQPVPVSPEHPNYKLYHSVDLPSDVALGKERTVFDGPRGVVRKVALGSTLVAQQFTVATPGYLTKVFAALTTEDGIVRTDSVARWEIRRDDNGKPGDIIPLTTTPVDIEGIDGFIPVSFIDGGLSDQDDPVAVYLERGLYWVVLTAQPLANVFAFFNDVPSNQRQGDFQIFKNNAWVSQDTANGIHFELSIRVVMQDLYHTLIAPGIYSLIGERYIVMRCKEIEENSYRSLAYAKHCLGLAKFQLGIVGYSETRFDFNGIPLREFHPIGKLSRLSLRFETSTGDLYDFKGINHDITFVVHYFEPMQKRIFERSILNPNYSGNVMKYISDYQMITEYESDDQDHDYDEDDLSEYRRQEARHLPENVRRLDLEALEKMRLYDDAYSEESSEAGA